MKRKKQLSWSALRRLMEQFPVIKELAAYYFEDNGVALSRPVQQLRNLTKGNWIAGVSIGIFLVTFLILTVKMFSEPFDSLEHQKAFNIANVVGSFGAGLSALMLWFRENRFAKKHNQELWKNFAEVIQNLLDAGAFGRISAKDTMSSLSSIAAGDLRIRIWDLDEVNRDLDDDRDPGSMRSQLKRRIAGYSAAGLANPRWEEYYPPGEVSAK